MSAPAKCPGCGTKLQPDWESCPNCPMSFHDAAPQKTALQSDGFRNLVLPVLLFGGLAFFVWSIGQYLWHSAEEGAKTVQAGVKSVPIPSGGGGGGVVPVNSKAIQGLVNEQVTGEFDSGGVAPVNKRPSTDDEEGTGTISIMPDKGPKARAAREWKMRGEIRDLITLKAVPGVKMTFIDNETNSRAAIVTDGQGRYRTILPPLPGRGYLVTLEKLGYEKTYLDPGTEGVPDMPLERRKEIRKELSSLIAEPSSIEPNSETPLVTNFYIAPK